MNNSIEIIKYYLSNILKVDEFTETFYTVIGSLFHFVLSKMNEDNFDLDKEYNYFLKDKEFSNKEKFFLDKLTIAFIASPEDLPFAGEP